MIEARKFDLSKDYGTICSWWQKHDSYAPMPDHLPPTGIIVENAKSPICAGFLYNTDSKICVFEFVVSNPEVSKEDRDKCLKLLIETIQEIAKELEYTLIYTSINIEAYIKKLKSAGFIEVDKNQTHMFFKME